MPAMLMKHDEDPAAAIRKRVGSVDHLTIFGNYVLVAIYERPKITKSGIHLSDQTIQEDQWQGKSALVLSCGPSAFISDSNYDFKEQSVKPGDWVAIFVSDGRKLVIQNEKTGERQLCRMVEDQHIRLKIPSPDSVY